MESHAAAIAAAWRKKLVLVVSRITRVWFDQHGNLMAVTEDTFEASYGPFLKVGGQRFLFESVERA